MGNVFDEVKDTITTNINERLGSPLLGSFALFWLVFNWRGLYFLLHPNDKLDSIAKLAHFEAHYTDLWHIFGWPAICAALFVWGYPFVAHYAFTHWKKKEQEKSDAAIVIRKQHYKSGEEYAELEQNYNLARAEIRLLNKKYEDDIIGSQKRHGVEMREVNSKIATLEEEASKFENQVLKKEKQLVGKIEEISALKSRNKEYAEQIDSAEIALSETEKHLRDSNHSIAEFVALGARVIHEYKKMPSVSDALDEALRSLNVAVEHYSSLNSIRVIIEDTENNNYDLRGILDID